jgi:hypothetical protein
MALNPQNVKPHEFKPGQSGNPKGRPPLLLRHILDEYKALGFEPITKAQIKEAYEILINLPEEVIIAACKEKKSPMLIRIVGKSMLAGKGFEIVERMIDRAQGRPAQGNLNLTGDLNLHNQADLSKLTDDDLRCIINAGKQIDTPSPDVADGAGTGAP